MQVHKRKSQIFWTAIGVLGGMAFGTALFNNIGVGVAFGISFGILFYFGLGGKE